MIKRKTISLIVVFFLPLALIAQIHYWVDEKGVQHYSSSPPESKKGIRNYQVVETLSEISNSEPESLTGNNSGSSTRLQKTYPKVVMYSLAEDSACISARNWLQKNNIPFQERDVKKDANAMRDFNKLQAGGVPFFVIGDQKLLGWNEDVIRNYLGMNNQPGQTQTIELKKNNE